MRLNYFRPPHALPAPENKGLMPSSFDGSEGAYDIWFVDGVHYIAKGLKMAMYTPTGMGELDAASTAAVLTHLRSTFPRGVVVRIGIAQPAPPQSPPPPPVTPVLPGVSQPAGARGAAKRARAHSPTPDEAEKRLGELLAQDPDDLPAA